MFYGNPLIRSLLAVAGPYIVSKPNTKGEDYYLSISECLKPYQLDIPDSWKTPALPKITVVEPAKTGSEKGKTKAISKKTKAKKPLKVSKKTQAK